ncbi:MAG: hypothetical protein P4L50_08545 [Anaerolineaceae bacterium]|nr:hypothetical protein [Anaerolineaceae bacterium]
MHTPSKLVVCLGFLLGGGVALAQAISPPIAEYRGLKAEGSFRIDNSSDQTMMVVLETKSFRVNDKGGVVYSPLHPQVHIDYGASSFSIQPHDSYTVYYKAVSKVSPVSFSIIPTMLPAEKKTGVRLGYVFPHMVYLYQKAKLAKSDVQVSLKDGNVVIVNNSEKLGRVEFIHDGSVQLSGFPLYPGQTRQLVVASANPVVNFEDGFKVEAK